MAGHRPRHDRRVTRVADYDVPLYGLVLLVVPVLAGAAAYDNEQRTRACALFVVIRGSRGHDGDAPTTPRAAPVATLAGI